MKRDKTKAQNLKLTVWNRSSWAFVWYATQAVIWTACFCVLFSLRDVFRALDVFTAVIGLQMQYLAELPKSIFCLISFIFTIKNVDAFCGVLLNMYRISKQDEVFKEVGSSVGIDGVQGVGKTRLIIYIGMVLQPKRWKELQYNYYIDCPVQKKFKADFENGLKWQYVRFLSRQYSVKKYIEEMVPHKDAHGIDRLAKIPLIYSNIKVTFKGQIPRDLDRKHFTMQERLLESNIKLASELDNMLPNTMRRVKQGSDDELQANAIDEFAGLDRQYTGGLLVADTHRNGALYLPIRDCQQLKYHIIENRYMYTPKLLVKLLKRFKNKVLKKGEQTSIHLRRVCKFLERAVRCIGFTKLYYFLESGPAGATVLNKNERLFFSLPNQVPYSYDDRVLQEQYPPLGYRKMPEPTKETKKSSSKKTNDADKNLTSDNIV